MENTYSSILVKNVAEWSAKRGIRDIRATAFINAEQYVFRMSGDLTGTDFVRLILAGERNFSGIQLENGFNITRHKYFEKLQDYLTKEYLSLCDNPLMLHNARLKGLCAEGMNLAFMFAKNADLEGACLYTADLRFADLRGANLKGVNFWKARLCNVYLQNANLAEANLSGADLHEAHIAGVKNLDRSRGLERAVFEKTRVGVKEQKIIRRKRDITTSFVREKPFQDYDLLGVYTHDQYAYHGDARLVIVESKSELELALVS